MAPPRVDKKKFSKEKSKKKTDKTDSKSSLPSTTIAVKKETNYGLSVFTGRWKKIFSLNLQQNDKK